MFRRLEETLRLYQIDPKPVLVSGGHANPFTPNLGENGIACDYLHRWGVRPEHIFSEAGSRDTFESAVAVAKILGAKGWRRYLLVTSAVHMPRSMQVFQVVAPEPVPAPGDFTTPEFGLSPLGLKPSEGAAQDVWASLHEYVGMNWQSTGTSRMRMMGMAKKNAIDVVMTSAIAANTRRSRSSPRC